MGFFQEAREATAFENEFRARKQTIRNLSEISKETLELQIFVMEYDTNRYLTTKTQYYETGQQLRGAITLYKRVLEEGIAKWRDKDYVMKEWEKSLMFILAAEQQGFRNDMILYFTGIQKAIAGLLEDELWCNLNSAQGTASLGFGNAWRKWDKYARKHLKEIIERNIQEKDTTNQEAVEDEDEDIAEDDYDEDEYF